MLFWLPKPTSEELQRDPEAFMKMREKLQTAEAIFSVAVALDYIGEKKMAEAQLRRSLEKNLNHLPSLYAMSLKSFERFQEKDAKRWFHRAIRIDQKPEENVLYLQRQLKFNLNSYEDASRFGIWCLKELESLKSPGLQIQFQLGKVYFEQSKFKDAIPYLRASLKEADYAQEAAEYLSYIFEHLYRGNELIERTLELAEEVPNRSDLFFNLAMVCQHDQRRLDMALHFFYLASREEPHDPGLRFSLEQACLELISDLNRSKQDPNLFLLMLAHLYQGSIGVAKRYASQLKGLKFPESFQTQQPSTLWQRWLLQGEGQLVQHLRVWFKETATVRKISERSSQTS